MEYTKEMHDALLNYIEGVDKKVDIVQQSLATYMNSNSKINESQDTLNSKTGEQFINYGNLFGSLNTILEGILAEQKRNNAATIANTDNLVKMSELVSEVNKKTLKYIQVLMEDYIVQIAKLTGQSQTEIGNQLLKKIQEPASDSSPLFIV